jgi:protein O-mannosyl-transferase
MKKQKKSPASIQVEPPALSHSWLFALFLAAVTLIAYQPVWHAGFIWDDDSILLNNPLIRQAGGWYQAWFNRAADDFVPATITSLWLEWRLWGANPLVYHLDNLLLHVCSAILLWRILLRLKIPGAWLAAALFAVHPVNVESVAWIAQRKNTLAMVFLLLSVQSYLTFEDSGRRRWYWLAAGLFVLALAAKTAVVPLPVVLLGLAWWRRGRIDRRDVRHSLVFFVLAAAGALMAVWIQQGAAIGVVVRTDSFWARLAGAGWALWFYLGKALLPLNLNFVYPRWKIPGGNPLAYLPLALWAAGLLICRRCCKGWGKGALFALGYFSLMLLPVLGFVNIYFMRYSLVADHWEYFAIIGPIALAAAIIKKPVAAAALLLALGALTWRQCGMYANEETLWQTTLRLNPHCPLACLNLGFGLDEKGMVDEAITYYREALQSKPDFEEAHNDLGYALLQKGRVDEAITHCREALQIRPAFAEAHYNLGNGLYQKGKVDEAITEYQNALQIKPLYVEAHYNLGVALGQQGKTDEAIAQYQAALQIAPANPIFQNSLAWLLATSAEASLRNGRKAVELARQANTTTGGENPMFLRTLAAALAESGRFSEAVETAQRALLLAGAQSNTGLAAALQAERELYQTGSPFHTPQQTH